MGSGKLLKAIMGSKKGKERSLKKDKGSSAEVKSVALKKNKPSLGTLNNSGSGEDSQFPVENLAATRIQAAFRAYKARKTCRKLKGIRRAKLLTEKQSVKKQAMVTLRYLHSWSQIQSQIKGRRVCMVTEGRLKQKRLEAQQKLEAKLHDIEVEWSGGPDTKEGILGRIHQREEAAVKRERALAYAFSHQWKVDGRNQWLGNYEVGSTNWGWSWKERWISCRPWEVRSSFQFISPKKPLRISPPLKKASSLKVTPKQPFSSGKITGKARRLSFPGSEEPETSREEVLQKNRHLQMVETQGKHRGDCPPQRHVKFFRLCRDIMC